MDEIIKNSFKTFFHHKIHDFGDMKMHKNLCQQLVPGSHDFILIFPVLKIFGFEVVLDHVTLGKMNLHNLACKIRVNRRICRFIYIDNGEARIGPQTEQGHMTVS